MNEQDERKAMARRVAIVRLANNIMQHARKIAQDPGRIAELLPELKKLVQQLEQVRGK